MAAGRLEEIQWEIAAVNRRYALGALERLREVLSGAALGFPVDRLAQCSRELAAAALLAAEGADAARRIAGALEAAEAAAAAPLPLQATIGGETSAGFWPDATPDDPDGVFAEEEDFPELDLLSLIRAAGSQSPGAP